MLIRYINRIKQVDRLIRTKSTGPADEFACKLQISKRQVYNIIDEFKSFGLCISYNRNLRSFVYDRPYKLDISFDVTELAEEDMRQTEGGGIFVRLFNSRKKHNRI